MRRAAALALATLSCAVLAGAAAAGEFTRRGTVTRVIAGDTVVVRLTGGASERVR